MKEMNIRGIQKKASKYKSYKGELNKILPNRLLVNGKRELFSNAPDSLWFTDISEFKTKECKLYLSPVLDGYTREIISYTISRSPNLPFVMDMIKKATKCKKINNLIIHSDQGWHYQHKHFQEYLLNHNIKQSMSRKGNCLDNSRMENFFGILKNELYYPNENLYETYDQLKSDIDEYIEYYNKYRISSILKGQSPYKYRQLSLSLVS